eukprot:CAMPEP_0174326658 /NCGR_PEP_ID=MMETSP0810-20121108/14043_1 /TAXON_ID=73025 ORGANISM="Eutreptiella gymnastica-like, Strain CCMP1594" /NCGR_SAMPLE_ID=MMETSP0810 /ASSEMBLY_ACC=CAM_ASM_000659 /LENGTH=83 /DNA_ID=CAMNT_0015440337 /DNA_START=395 /DNA_END=646 /DNA_ORIENTATION=+
MASDETVILVHWVSTVRETRRSAHTAAVANEYSAATWAFVGIASATVMVLSTEIAILNPAAWTRHDVRRARAARASPFCVGES